MIKIFFIFENFLRIFDRYFNRDVDCIRSFFKKKFDFEADEWPVFTVDTEKKYSLDVAIAASGFSKEHQQEFEKVKFWRESFLAGKLMKLICR